MAEGFTFAVSASHKKIDYRVVLRDAQEIERVIQNLKQDPLWGWCEPQVTITFDRFQEVVTLDRGSYTSEADFRASADYEQLEEVAIHSLQVYLRFVIKVFQQRVEEYYQGKGEQYQDLNYRLVRFDEVKS